MLAGYSSLEVVGVLSLALAALTFFNRYVLNLLLALLRPQPPKVTVTPTKEEAEDHLEGYPKFDQKQLEGEAKIVHMWDPSTLDYFGSRPAMDAEEVNKIVASARVAQLEWKKSSFDKRRLLMRTMCRFFTENQETCARVAVRESGKTLLDALIGEILVTCEKLTWLAESGEQYLQREYRDTGRMMVMKRVYVDWTPLGVIGAIVPWNYPFHNVFNPVSAALFSGNAIVIKVSEYASWSITYYKRVIDACLDAVGAPRDLVLKSCHLPYICHSVCRTPIEILTAAFD